MSTWQEMHTATTHTHCYVVGIGNSLLCSSNYYIHPLLDCWLLGFYVLVTVKVISRRVPTLTCDNAHSLRHYSAAPMADQCAITMTLYPTQSRYPDTKQTSPYHILIMQSAWLGSEKCKLLSHWLDSSWIQTHGLEYHDLPKLKQVLNSLGRPIGSAPTVVSKRLACAHSD